MSFCFKDFKRLAIIAKDIFKVADASTVLGEAINHLILTLPQTQTHILCVAERKTIVRLSYGQYSQAKKFIRASCKPDFLCLLKKLDWGTKLAMCGIWITSCLGVDTLLAS